MLDWVFAYGSLIWSPEFEPIEERPGALHGFHRSLCLYSWYHRGTRERPGLVLGLDDGGSCHGVVQAFRLRRAPRLLAALDRREMPDDSYVRRRVDVRTAAGVVRAWAYVVNHRSAQYAAGLETAEVVRLVRQGQGGRGANAAYLRQTVAALQRHGIADHALENFARLVETTDVAHSSLQTGFSTAPRLAD